MPPGACLTLTERTPRHVQALTGDSWRRTDARERPGRGLRCPAHLEGQGDMMRALKSPSNISDTERTLSPTTWFVFSYSSSEPVTKQKATFKTLQNHFSSSFLVRSAKSRSSCFLKMLHWCVGGFDAKTDMHNNVISIWDWNSYIDHLPHEK